MISSHSITALLDDSELLLPVKTADILLDEKWLPYCQVTLICPAVDPALLAAVDPRVYSGITITITQEWGRIDRIRDLSRRWAGTTLADISAHYFGGTLADISADSYHSFNTPGSPYEEPFVRYMALGIRSRRIDHEAGEVTITAASDDALLEDDAHIGNAFLPVAGALLRDRVEYVLSRLGEDLDDIDPAAAAVSADPESELWEPGQSAFDYIMPQVRKAGLELWCDELGTWHLREARIVPPGTAVLESTGTIKNASDTISRDSTWANAVVLTYKWTDDEGTNHTVVDSAYMPGFIIRDTRVYRETIDKPFPGYGRARSMLKTFLARGRVSTVTAVADYSTTPGQALDLTLPSTPLQEGYVSSVNFSFPADEMRVVTRELVDAGSITTEED